MRRKRPIVSAALATTAVAAILVACSGESGSIGFGDLASMDASTKAQKDSGVLLRDAAINGGGNGGDATLSNADADADAAPVGCGEFSGDDRQTCSKDGLSLGECVDGGPVVESCPNGCLRASGSGSDEDDVCMGTDADWSCDGSYSTSKQKNGHYYLTSFGCWLDADGNQQTDPGDNCQPACQLKLEPNGICVDLGGEDCEDSINWYVADAGRFGCGAHLRVTNPANGSSVIVMVIDDGPGCDSVEDNVSYGVLDASGRVDAYLFGGQKGFTDEAKVTVVEVDDSYPLGPE